ncbi:hypothetical protein [Asticcacaulis solisilvae]|uniref:hypothetical protein n=1 Tax=Asticcacaulis solisilvae TaxID=1217274 RepID=UPI003FD762BD
MIIGRLTGLACGAAIFIAGPAIAQTEAAPPAALSRIPLELSPIIHQRAEPVTHAEGHVEDGRPILTVPFAYNRMFRLKTDRTFTSIFLVKMTEAPKGTLGFYAGQFNAPDGAGRGELMCMFPKFSRLYLNYPDCFLRNDADPDGKIAQVKVESNVPAHYYVVTYNGTPMFAYSNPPLDAEDGVFVPDHDFRLNLTVSSWHKGVAHVEWKSDDGVALKQDMATGADGAVDIPLDNGILHLRPNDDEGSDVSFTASAP